MGNPTQGKRQYLCWSSFILPCFGIDSSTLAFCLVVFSFHFLSFKSLPQFPFPTPKAKKLTPVPCISPSGPTTCPPGFLGPTLKAHGSQAHQLPRCRSGFLITLVKFDSICEHDMNSDIFFCGFGLIMIVFGLNSY